MAIPKIKPWLHGPLALLRHAESHRLANSDFDKRIALIGFDNAIESSITTYLSLHPTQRNNRKYEKADIQKWRTNFHSLLDFLEQHAAALAATMVIGRDEMIFYHSLRNELYHDGKGFVPAEEHLSSIRESALWTFSILFECDAEELLDIDSTCVEKEPAHTDMQMSPETEILQNYLLAKKSLESLLILQGQSKVPLNLMEGLRAAGKDDFEASPEVFVETAVKATEIKNRIVSGASIEESDENLRALANNLNLLTLNLNKQLRSYQRDIVETAVNSTIRAQIGNHRAGVVIQTTGTGITLSMVAYLIACRQTQQLKSLHIIVLVDRMVFGDQLMNVIQEFGHQQSGLNAIYPKLASDLSLALQNVQAQLIITSVQRIKKADQLFRNTCLVVSFNANCSANELAATFPAATFIQFTSHANDKESRSSFGEIIFDYGLKDAMQEGYLRPCQIVAIPSPIQYCEISLGMLETAEARIRSAETILAQFHRLHPEGKGLGVVVVADRSQVVAMAETLTQLERARCGAGSKAPIQIHMVGPFVDGKSSGDTSNESSGLWSERGLLIMTKAWLGGFDVETADSCFVTCPLSLLARTRIIALVGRLAPGKEVGTIIDFVGNQWDF